MSFSVFGGSGDVDKKTTVNNTTTTNTTTNTSMGDVGLTGDAAIALESVFANRAVQQSSLQASSFDKLVAGQQSGLAVQGGTLVELGSKLISGVTGLSGQAAAGLEEIGARSERSAANLLSVAKDVASPAAAAQETVRTQTKSLTVVIIAIAAIAGLAFMARKGGK